MVGKMAYQLQQYKYWKRTRRDLKSAKQLYPSQQDRRIQQLGFDPWKILNSNAVSTILPKLAGDRMGNCVLFCFFYFGQCDITRFSAKIVL